MFFGSLARLAARTFWRESDQKQEKQRITNGKKQKGVRETKRSKMVWKNRKMEPEGSKTKPKNTKIETKWSQK